MSSKKKEAKKKAQKNIKKEYESQEESNSEIEIAKKIFLNDKSYKQAKNPPSPSTSTNDKKGKRKDSSKQQSQIMKNINKNNITQNIKAELKKFDPPPCNLCKNRNADRVCINKECGESNFMSLICGKCHYDVHQKYPQKSEIDIEEFFIKLGLFINEQNDQDDYQIGQIDKQLLEQSIDQIQEIRTRLDYFRQQLQNDIKEKDKDIYQIVSDSSIKALSQCEFDNVQLQLKNIKECIYFKSNKLYWIDCYEKYKNYINKITELNNDEEELRRTIEKSFQGIEHEISLREINANICNKYIDVSRKYTFNGSMNLTAIAGLQQWFLDYKLSKNTKYKLRFKIESCAPKYVFIGIMSQKKVHAEMVPNDPKHYFCYSFNSHVQNDSTKVLKGKRLYELKKNNQEFEMRIDFENNYMDFYDYPNIDNICRTNPKQKMVYNDYVITILFMQLNTISIQYFSQIDSLENII